MTQTLAHISRDEGIKITPGIRKKEKVPFQSNFASLAAANNLLLHQETGLLHLPDNTSLLPYNEPAVNSATIITSERSNCYER